MTVSAEASAMVSVAPLVVASVPQLAAVLAEVLVAALAVVSAVELAPP